MRLADAFHASAWRRSHSSATRKAKMLHKLSLWARIAGVTSGPDPRSKLYWFTPRTTEGSSECKESRMWRLPLSYGPVVAGIKYNSYEEQYFFQEGQLASDRERSPDRWRTLFWVGSWYLIAWVATDSKEGKVVIPLCKRGRDVLTCWDIEEGGNLPRSAPLSENFASGVVVQGTRLTERVRTIAAVFERSRRTNAGSAQWSWGVRRERKALDFLSSPHAYTRGRFPVSWAKWSGGRALDFRKMVWLDNQAFSRADFVRPEGSSWG